MVGDFVARRRAEILDGCAEEKFGRCLDSPCGTFRMRFGKREPDGCYEIARIGTGSFSDWEVVRLDLSYSSLGAYRIEPGGGDELIYDRESGFGSEDDAERLADEMIKAYGICQRDRREAQMVPTGR